MVTWCKKVTMIFMEFKLSRICLISLSKYFWDFKDIKKQRLDFFRDDWTYMKHEWYSLAKQVMNHAGGLFLPAKLKLELEEVIFFIGEEIYFWTEFLLKDLVLDVPFAEEVYFSSFGSIDEGQIFEKYWSKNGELFTNSDVNYDLFEFACVFAMTDFIFEYRNKIIETIMSWVRLIKCSSEPIEIREKEIAFIWNDLERKSNEFEKDSVVYILLVNWLFVRWKWTYVDFDKDLKAQKVYCWWGQQSPQTLKNTEMFEVSLSVNYTRLCKYFLSKVSDSSKDSFNQLALRALKDEFRNDSKNHWRQKLTEIALCTINNISAGERSLCLANEYGTLLSRTFQWPYQEAFLNIFDYANAFPRQLSTNKQKKVLLFIVKQDEKDVANQCPIKKKINCVIFKNIWEQASQDLKRDRVFYRKLIEIYFKMCNFSTLKVLLKCYLSEMDNTLLFNFHQMLNFEEEIVNWIKEDKFALLNKFMESAFDEDEDRKKFLNAFKKKLVNYAHFNGVDYIILDKFLTWLSSFNGSDINLLKSKINAKQVIDTMLDSGDNSDEVDKFLKWLYNSSDKKINAIKYKFKSEDYAHSYIFHNISSPRCEFEEMERKCSEFLKIVFNNSYEEIENFKLNVLIKDESSILDYGLVCDSNYDERFGEKDFFPIENLLKFCKLPEGRVIELKKRCSDNVFKLMNLFALKCNTFVVLDDFLDWIVKNQEEKKNLIIKFMKTENGIYLCNKMLNLEDSLYVGEQKILYLNFYNRWVKICENLSEVRKTLEALNSDNFNHLGDFQLSWMFDKLQKGKD